MRLVRLNSVKSGATPEGRRVLAGVAVTTAAPVDADEGYPLVGGLGIWTEAAVGGTTPSFGLTLWVYSYTALRWFPWLTTTYTEDSRERWTLPGGPARIYVQVTAASGTTPTLSLWITEWTEE